MTPYNVAYLVTVLWREIGADRRITPHSLRHSAITVALDAGIGLRDVQDFARHEDPKTTRRYDRARNPLNRHATSRDRPVPRRRQLTPLVARAAG
jgi:integrase/recombinase XerD